MIQATLNAFEGFGEDDIMEVKTTQKKKVII